MDDLMRTVAMGVALLCNGLLGGVFLAFACAIVPGLRRVDDHVYVTAFRAVNAAILNGWFLTVFLGAPLFAIAAVVVSPTGSAQWWAVAGLVCAIVTFVVTAAVNVPLNQRLDAASGQAPSEQASARRAFERRWNAAHLIRTATSVGAAGFLTIAVLV